MYINIRIFVTVMKIKMGFSENYLFELISLMKEWWSQLDSNQ